MNQSKFSLADVLTVLTALIFGFISFMGANFLNLGKDTVWGMNNTAGCIVIALFCSGLLFATAFGAKLLKGTNRNFKIYFVGEILLLILFVLFAVFFVTKASPFTHYFTVTEQESAIRSKLNSNISEAENMFVKYEIYSTDREKNYELKLQTIILPGISNPDKYTKFGFDSTSGVTDQFQITSKMITFHQDLFPNHYTDTISRNGIKEVASKWFQDAKNTTNSWKPIGIVGVVTEIEKKSNDWLNTLVTFSKARGPGENTSQIYDFPSGDVVQFNDVKTHFTKLKNPSPLTVVLALLAYVLMLLSWFVTKRSTKSDIGFRALSRILFYRKQEKITGNYDIDY